MTMGMLSERLVYSVAVSAFRMGKYEVTFDQGDACVAGRWLWGLHAGR